MKFKLLKNKKGFALLFSVLVSSLLLTIGLSILNVSLKELAISTASRQSIFAFYAADSGREYAIYNDTKKGGFSTFNPDQKDTLHPADDFKPAIGTIPVDITDQGGQNFTIELKKHWHDGTFSQIDTTVTSIGHDTDSGDVVERAIYQSY